MTKEINWKKWYDENTRKYKEEYKIMDYGSSKSMYARYQAASNILQIEKNMLVLDAGCGLGTFGNYLLNRKKTEIHIIGLDISENMIRLARQKTHYHEFVVGSITSICFKNCMFDCVTCLEVLQNFNGSVEAAISELIRILKRGGKFFLTTLDKNYIGFKSGERRRNPINRYYSPEDLVSLCESFGISIKRLGAISTDSTEFELLPLHASHVFFIYGEKVV